MGSINVSNVKRNSRDFSFIETLGSFINNYEFEEGFRDWKLNTSEDTRKSYIWNALSAIGDNYAETIYENVLNYLDNVSNVDLCKAKSLQSIVKMLGIDYQVVYDVGKMPVEIANLIDILSINRHYLADNKTFASCFINELSSFSEDCIVSAKQNDYLSIFLSSKLNPYDVDASQDPYNGLSTLPISIVSSEVTTQKFYIDDGTYYNFLTSLFQQVLTTNVYMKYADAESGISKDTRPIFEHIADQLVIKSNNSQFVMSPYDVEIRDLKLKYKLENFKQDEIVDAIENNTDYIDRYNQYEQIVLKKEIEKREAPYALKDQTAIDEGKDLRYNIARYSYYREKKVIEYFKFIEDTYNSLIMPEEIKESIQRIEDTDISIYDKDENYFVVDQKKTKKLLYKDDQTNSYQIRSDYIRTIAKLLADQVLEIADIRDQVKIQLRKSYLKGTFLLLSYVINEYLKYNIQKTYGSVFYDADNVALSTYIQRSLSSDDSVQLVEYYDQTQYYNISADEDDEVEGQMSSIYEKPVAIKNKDEVNPKFWDDLDSKIGINTMDLPLNEIDEFYRKSLKMNLRSVETSSNLVNFLSIIYGYGANNSFWDLSNDQFVCQVKSEDLSSREWLGDISTTIQIEEKNRDEVSVMIDDMNLQIANGYQQTLSTVAWQVSDLTSFMSSYWTTAISSQNADIKEVVFGAYDRYLDQNSKFQEELDDISNDFKDLSSDPKYTLYLSGYNVTNWPIGLDGKTKISKNNLSLLINQLCTFVYSCNGDITNPDGFNGIKFANDAMRSKLSGVAQEDGLSGRYLSCQQELSNLIENYVKKVDAFKNYFTNSNSEITAQTQALASYIQSESSTARNTILQHQQNHLNKLITYKEEVNNMIDTFIEASAMYTNFEIGICKKTGTVAEIGDTIKFKYWTTKASDDILGYDPFRDETHDHVVAWHHDEYKSEYSAINAADPISMKLDALQERCNVYFGTEGETRYCYDDMTTSKDGERHYATLTSHYSSKEQKWKDYYSTTVATKIKADLQQLATDFYDVLKMINIELKCLDETNDISLGPIPTPTAEVDMDNVGAELQSLFKSLIAKIETLDNEYVKVEHFVETDKYYSELASKLNAINWVLSAVADYGSGRQPPVTPSPSNNPWNIKAIDDYFHQIEQDFEKLKSDNSDYLSEYAETGAGRIIDQIQKMVDWMLKYDKDNQKHVIREASALMLTERQLFARHRIFMQSLEAQFVDGIGDDLHYVMAKVPFSTSHSDPLYIEHNIAAIDSWISACKLAFDNGDDGTKVGKYQQGAIAIIANKVKVLPQFIESCRLLDVFVRKHYQGNAGEDIIYLLDAMRQTLEAAIRRIKHIEESAPSYEAQKEIFLKYSGMDIGYDPFYNYTNLTHSSYQIHPYLYNFIEKLNVVYPLAETFFITFTKDYEKELIEKGLDNLIGKYGNVINLWKYGMFDWSGYQSQYEYLASKEQPTTIPDTFGFTGAFYPPALDQFLYDSQAFIQMVEDDVPESPYYKLRLPIEQCIHIGQQLQKYEGAIREIAQRQEGNSASTPCLSNEYDIYKYTEDVYGNSWILFKSYQHIIREHQQNDTLAQRQLNPNWLSSIDEDGNVIWDYTPTYQEKKNAPGEVWFRLKNHPIAFPAFDMLSEDEDVTVFLSDIENKHEYIRAVDAYFAKEFGDHEDWKTIKDITRDSIARANKGKKDVSHLRCFFDIELNPGKDSVLLVVPYQTGSNHDGKLPGKRSPNSEQDLSMFQYANSSIIIGKIQFSTNDRNFTDYKFSQYRNTANIEDVSNNIDNISNPADLVRLDNYFTYIYDFIGFAKNGNRIFAVFVKKNVEGGAGESYRNRKKTFNVGNKRNRRPQLNLAIVSYNGHKLQKSFVTTDLKYDVIFKAETDGKPTNEPDIYKYANALAITYDNKYLTIGYVSEEFQVKDGKQYSADTSVVNFCEYTNAIENRRELSTCGQNPRYPSDTAVLQTVDSQHINIYNSFDSFTSYVVLVSFKFSTSTLIANGIKYYNLNTDLGYLPVFADLKGKTRFYCNSALSAKQEYNVELLGPENSDIDYTPVIIDQASDKYGRVTEDYREYNKVTAFSPEITFNANEESAEFTLALSDVFVDDHGKSTYEDIAETGALTSYSYTFTNTTYVAMPVAVGKLSVQHEISNYYLSSEKYDLLSGQDIIGPNGVTYQGTIASNHIENISAIQLEVKYDEENVPIAIGCCLQLRHRVKDQEMILPRNKFLLTVYAKNNLASYDYYHIMENPNHYVYEWHETSAASVVYKDENRDIDFFRIDSLSDYQTTTGKYPFRNFAGDVKAKDMSAMLEFKYSEDEPIDREFPELATEIVEDEVILMSNENQYIYFYALDGFDTTEKDTFFMEKYEDNQYKKIKVNTTSRKYQDFYDRALTIETTYNVEDFGADPESKDPNDHKYEIVQYFNYKNFTSPCYIDFKKQYKADGTADVPISRFYPSTAKEIQHTYLRLRPGQSGRLDLQFDYVEYAKVKASDLGQTIVGKETRLVRTYYIMNVSDDKPKFIISRTPFVGNVEDDWHVTNTNREEPIPEEITVTWQSEIGTITIPEKFYKGQYLTFTDKGLTDPLSGIVGWDVLQYNPGYYRLGETIQLSTSITCDAQWEDLHTEH